MMADRAQFNSGLVLLAGALIGHDSIPLPASGRVTPIAITFLNGDWEAQQAARAAAAALLPCEFTEQGDETYSRLRGRLGGPDGLLVELTAFAQPAGGAS